MRAESALRTISNAITAPVAPPPALNPLSSPNRSLPSAMLAMERVDHLLRRAMQLIEIDREAALRCLSDASVLLKSDNPQLSTVSGTVRRGSLVRWQAERVLAYIEDNLGSKLAISDLAHVVAFSESYFCRAFKLSFGVSSMSYVTARRIERAKLLMTSSRMQLSDIALACGFADQAHLSKSFRRWVGVSPGLWRRYNANMVGTSG